MDVVKTIDYKGYHIHINLDPDPINPRKEWDNQGTMICLHPRYELGDDHEQSLGKRLSTDKFSGWDAIEKYLRQKHDAKVILPVYLYEHGGLTMNTTGFSCSWDSGQVGFIFMSANKIRSEMNWKKLTSKRLELVVNNLRAEVEEYDQYLRGDCYGFTVEAPDGHEVADDNVWGFMGDIEKSGLLEQAKNAIDYDLELLAEVEKIKKMSDEDVILNINTTWKSEKATKAYKERARCLKQPTSC